MQGKRGQTLEKKIEYTNNVYRKQGKALVDKIPTPWNVHYNKRTGKVIRAFPQKKSIVDFTGVSHGKSIAFDTKSTKQRTRFPLDNIQLHQIEYLIQHQDQGGISFFIIEFEKHQEAYFLPVDDLVIWWEQAEKGGRKSIPYSWFMVNCDVIQSRNGAILDYLEFCNTIYKKKGDSV